MGMNDEVDMRKYGALRKVMPITFATFGLGIFGNYWESHHLLASIQKIR